MTKPSLTQFIDDAMRLRRTDAARIERETGLDANWTRQFKAGRMKSRPDPDRVHTLARALGVDEAELWQYLDRYDMVSALRAQPAEHAKEPGEVDLAGLVAALANALQAQAQTLTDIQLALAQAARDAASERMAAAALLGHLSDQLDELRELAGRRDGFAVPGSAQN